MDVLWALEVVTVETKPGLLDSIVGLGHGSEHPIGDGAKMASLTIELFRERVAPIHLRFLLGRCGMNETRIRDSECDIGPGSEVSVTSEVIAPCSVRPAAMTRRLKHPVEQEHRDDQQSIRQPAAISANRYPSGPRAEAFGMTTRLHPAIRPAVLDDEGQTATRQTPVEPAFATPADADRLERTADALEANGFAVELLPNGAAARTRIRQLIADGCSILTSASETLRLTGVEADINSSDRYDAVKPRLARLDRATDGDRIRRDRAAPDVAVGSVVAVTEGGTVVIASASGSQLPAFAGGAGRTIWIVGAQKIVADLDAALRRIETYAYPLENARALAAYGRPSAINKLLVVNREPVQGRSTILLLREAIGF